MDYNLAKQLKDAGFSQRRGCSACLHGYAFDYSVDPTPIGEQIETDDKWVSHPSLSELIEACGDEFDQLERGWIARTFSKRFGKYGGLEIEGKTPQEAVARLWLALNGSASEVSQADEN